MQIIPPSTIRAMFRTEFDKRHLDSEQRSLVDVEGEVSHLESAQKQYVGMAERQKEVNPTLATQEKLDRLVAFRVNKRIEDDLKQLAVAG